MRPKLCVYDLVYCTQTVITKNSGIWENPQLCLDDPLSKQH